MKLLEAGKMAAQLIRLLEPCCEKIEIAGSIRRQKKEVKDIEIVVLPKDKIGGYAGREGERMLSKKLAFLEDKSRIRMIKNGEKYKQFMLTKRDGKELISVDLFIVTPPAQWGVIYAIRTGPASFSKWLVSYRKPQGYKFKDGVLINPIGEKLTTPTEKSLFNTLGTGFIPVEKRNEY